MRQRNSRSREAFLGLCAALLATFGVPAEGGAQSSTAFQWVRWEQSITSKKNYDQNGAGNPYRDLILAATFINPANGAQFQRYGFWDGGSTFKIRAAFPPGTWNWTTSCTGTTAGQSCATGETPSSPTDSGLNRSGTVIVSARTTTGNSLYDRGYPVPIGWTNVSTGESRNLLRYGDKITPFLWIGDTAWVAPVLASTTGDWTTYVQNRRNKKYTVVLLALAPVWAKPDPQQQQPATFQSVTGTCTQSSNNVPHSCSRWVPAYWRSLDDKVQVANDNDLLVLLAGLNDPLDKGNKNNGHLYPLKNDAVVFARNLAARMSGSHVIFSAAFDDHKDTLDVSGTKQETTMREVIRATNPQYGIGNPDAPRQLTTIHLAGGSNYADYEAFNDLVHLHVFHSGHGNNNCLAGESPQLCALRRAREMTLFLGHFSDTSRPVMPVCDGEALYEADLVNAVEPDTPHRVRQAAHLTTLSGAFGFTTGIGRIKNNNSYTATGGIFPWTDPLSWVESASSREMTHLRNLFFSRPWKDLVPYHCNPPTSRCGNLIRNQGTAQDQKMVVSVTTNSKLAIAYLPNNLSLWLDTSRFPGLTATDTRWSKQWLNPRTGQPATGGPIVNKGTNVWEFGVPTIRCPEGGSSSAGSCDWVLVLQDTCSSCATAATGFTQSSLRVWQGRPSEGVQPGILAQLVDSTGRTVTEEIVVTTAPEAFHKLPQVARSRSGQSLIVWQSEHLDGSLWGVFGRLYSPAGQPLGEPFQINTWGEHDQSDAAVAAAGDGFIVAWMSYGQDGDLGGLYAQRYDAKGERVGPELQVHTTTAGHQGFPQVAAHASGNFVIAWESAAPDGSGRGIYAQLFDRQGNRRGGELRLDSAHAPGADLVSLAADPLEGFSIDWQSFDGEGSDLGRFGQRFGAQGERLGTVFQVLPPAGR